MGLFGARGGYRSGSDHSQSPPMTPTEVSMLNFIPLNEPAPAELQGYQVTVDLIRSEHLVAARSSVRDPEILKELQDEIERDCEWLRNFLLAAKVCYA
jgi:aspartate kinase